MMQLPDNRRMGRGHGNGSGAAVAVSVLALWVVFLLVPGCRPPDRTARYPERSIDLIVPWAAGGGTDRVARFVADALQRRLGQPVIVVNRTGGGGAVGHAAGALAGPDGYTLTMATFELGTMRAMGISQLTPGDLAAVTQVNADAAAVFVRKDAPWATLPALLDAIRAEPGKLKMSGTATGGAWDLARSGLLLAAGIAVTNVIWVPAQGSAPALVELLGGHIDAVCCSVPEAAAQLEAGQVRLLGVMGRERLSQYPEAPTARELGVAYEAEAWRGIMVPKGTPPAIARVLADHLEQIARSDEFRAFMQKNGFTIKVRGPDEFATFLRDQVEKWSGVIREAGYDKLGNRNDPGPRAMPMILGVGLVMAAAGVWLADRRRLAVPGGEGAEAEERGPWLPREAVLILVALVVYLGVMPRVGFQAATAVFATVMMLRLGSRWWVAGTAAIAMVTFIHLLFVVLFKVQLP